MDSQEIFEFADLNTEARKRLFGALVRLLPKAKPDVENEPLSNILNVLQTLKCSSAIIEHPYEDQDFLYDYTHQHASGFQDCRKTCARVHFFSGKPISKDRLLNDLARYDCRAHDKDAPEDLDQYLGYTVIRPTGDRCVGRTVIRNPFAGDDKRHLHIHYRYRTFLHGVALEVDGTPYMQQDESNHVCAGAALWAMSYHLHARHGTIRLFPRQITEIADESRLYRSGATGLSPIAMARVLAHLGCTVDIEGWSLREAASNSENGEQNQQEEKKRRERRRRELRKFIHTVHSYISSNVPVLVGYWSKSHDAGHAVLVVGHDFDPSCSKWEGGRPPGWREPTDGTPCDEPIADADYVTRLYCMDDERGLFQPLEIWNGGNETTAAAGEQPLDVLENMWGVAFVAGLTNATKMFYRDALASAREVLQRKMSEPEDDKDLREDFVSLAAETRWRITIQNSRSFRATFPDKQRGRSGFGDSLELAYRTMPLPLLVYVCEFCDFDTTITDRPLVHGEILLDPTSPAFANADRLLTVRTYEFLFSGKGKNYLSPEEIDNKYFVRPILDRPHGPICR